VHPEIVDKPPEVVYEAPMQRRQHDLSTGIGALVRRDAFACLVAALAVTVPAACKKKDAETTEDSTVADADASSPTEKPIEEAAVAQPRSVEPSLLADAPVSYPMALDPLLDLVPASERSFFAVRDPAIVLSLLETYVVRQMDLLASTAGSGDAELGTEARKAITMIDQLRGELARGVLDPDKGIVFLPRGGTVILGTDDPRTLPRLLEKIGVEERPEHCARLEGVEGYAACSEDASALAELATPGKGAATLRRRVAELLPGVDLERANLVAHVDLPTGPLAAAVATTTTQVHAAVSLGDLAEPAGLTGSARPTALGLLAPGSTFVWANLDMTTLKPQLTTQGPPVSTVGATLTGEFLFGGLEGGALALLAGVDDPAPAAGLVAMAAMTVDQLPTELDDGTKLSVKVEKLDIAGKEAQVLHASLSGSPQVDAMRKMGFSPELFAFSAGKVAGTIVGGDVSTVKQTAERDAGGPSPEFLSRLPGPLARSLAAAETAWAMHFGLDGLQAPVVTSALTDAFRQGAANAAIELPPEKIADGVFAALAPYSSVSVWMTHPAKERVTHVVIDGVIEVESDEGSAVREALAAIAQGADRTTTYRDLSTRFSASPRAARFTARAGDDPAAIASATTSTFVAGVVAAIAIPAFTKYIERSRAAAELLEPPSSYTR
jgi:hypothetical protein